MMISSHPEVAKRRAVPSLPQSSFTCALVLSVSRSSTELKAVHARYDTEQMTNGMWYRTQLDECLVAMFVPHSRLSSLRGRLPS